MDSNRYPLPACQVPSLHDSREQRLNTQGTKDGDLRGLDRGTTAQLQEALLPYARLDGQLC